MDQVPLIFIESVTRNSSLPTSQGLEQLSSAWGIVGEVQTKRSGFLNLTFSLHYDHGRMNWRLSYRMEGFDHIESRTLSREVVREMSKSITSIQFHLSRNTVSEDNWHSVAFEDVDLLLADLDAPKKELELDLFGFSAKLYAKLRPRCLKLFKGFTSLKVAGMATNIVKVFFAFD
uniref:MATH domain-containing protein n=1 Tax=Steinernema glaseri TaxID=37863 RepID=A0A1I7YD30_9BILA